MLKEIKYLILNKNLSIKKILKVLLNPGNTYCHIKAPFS